MILAQCSGVNKRGTDARGSDPVGGMHPHAQVGISPLKSEGDRAGPAVALGHGLCLLPTEEVFRETWALL